MRKEQQKNRKRDQFFFWQVCRTAHAESAQKTHWNRNVLLLRRFCVYHAESARKHKTPTLTNTRTGWRKRRTNRRDKTKGERKQTKRRNKRNTRRDHTKEETNRWKRRRKTRDGTDENTKRAKRQNKRRDETNEKTKRTKRRTEERHTNHERRLRACAFVNPVCRKLRHSAKKSEPKTTRP